jgi:hypothetical protein
VAYAEKRGCSLIQSTPFYDLPQVHPFKWGNFTVPLPRFVLLLSRGQMVGTWRMETVDRSMSDGKAKTYVMLSQ